MVSDGRNEGNWRTYLKAARAGLIALALLLICAASGVAQPKADDGDKASPGKYGGSQAVPAGPSSPIIIEVEPSAQEVEAIAEQQSDYRRVMGEPPDIWVAIFTLVLGASTIGLWIATRELNFKKVSRYECRSILVNRFHINYRNHVC